MVILVSLEKIFIFFANRMFLLIIRKFQGTQYCKILNIIAIFHFYTKFEQKFAAFFTIYCPKNSIFILNEQKTRVRKSPQKFAYLLHIKNFLMINIYIRHAAYLI
jgi:hypothetical protein